MFLVPAADLPTFLTEALASQRETIVNVNITLAVITYVDRICMSQAKLTIQGEFGLTDKQIRFYVDKYKPYDKAGAYAIQEWIGVIGIRSIKGDFYNVMGLPISRLIKTLQHLNIV